MKISSKFASIIFTFSLALGIIAYLGQQSITELGHSFNQLQAQTAPALTSLLAAQSAARRASIKAIEYSRRGNPKDRSKAEEALQQLDAALVRYRNLAGTDHPQTLAAPLQEFQTTLQQFLTVSEGPPIEQVVKEEENLQATRRALIEAVNAGLVSNSQKIRYQLQIIKSQARKVSVNLIEFALRGNQADREMAREAILAHRQTLQKFNEISFYFPDLQATIEKKVDPYIASAENFLRLLSTRKQPIDQSFRKEAELQQVRKTLVQAIYPLLDGEYARLNQTTLDTSQQLEQVTRIQFYSIIGISILIFIATLLLTRLIIAPIKKLNTAIGQVTQGRFNVKINSDSKDEIGQLTRRFLRMTESLQQQRQALEESEKKFSSAFYGLPIPMGILDLDQAIRTDCNEAYCQHLGFSREEIVGHTYLRDDFWQDREQQQQTVRNILQNGYVFNQPTDIRIKSGEVRTFLFSAAKLNIDDRNLAIVSLLDITDRIQLDIKLKLELKKLREAEIKLEHAQHIAHLGTWEFDIINNKIYWSDETYRIFELEKGTDPLDFETFLGIIHPDDRLHLQSTFEQSLASKTPYEIEHRLQMPDGRIKYMLGKGESQYDENGAPVRTLGTVQDITEHKQNESIAQRMNRMFEHSIEEIYLFDAASLQFIQVSHGALYNLGYSQQEIEQMTPVDIKPDYDRAQFQQMLTPLLSGDQKQLVFETRHQRKNGSTYPVEVRLQYTRGDTFPAFLAIILDLTERKKTEAELQQHRQHLEQLVDQRTAEIRLQARIIDQTHDSVITVDMDGKITSWNGGAERMFHYPAQTMLGKPIASVYPPGSEDFLQNQVVAPTLESGLHEIEVRLQRADGSIFPGHLSLSMLYDEQQQPVGIAGYTIDLSEIKKREQQLETLQRQLQESNKELEAFSYSVSHDLRAPLRSIDGFSLAIVEDYADKLDESGKDYLQRVRKAAQKMGQLIDDLLELSRVNRMNIEKQTLSLNELAHKSFDLLVSGDPQRQIELVMEDDMQIEGDPRLCGILMDNLIGNAWKFTAGQENARITIKSLPDKPQLFYIKDNGVGFDMRHADKLFGAFQRLHQQKEFPGTGVGLATVQRIVHRHGGRIWAESAPDEGATFFFTLTGETE